MIIQVFNKISTEEKPGEINPMLQMLRDRLPPMPKVKSDYFRIFIPSENIILKRFEVTQVLTVKGKDEFGNTIVNMPLSEVEKAAKKPKNNTAGILTKDALLYEYSYSGPLNPAMRNVVTETVLELLRRNLPNAIVAEIDRDIRINGDKFSGIDSHSIDTEEYAETHDFAIQTMYYDKAFFDQYLTSNDTVTNRGITGIQNHNSAYTTEKYLSDFTEALQIKFSNILKEDVAISFADMTSQY